MKRRKVKYNSSPFKVISGKISGDHLALLAKHMVEVKATKEIVKRSLRSDPALLAKEYTAINESE